MATWKKILLEGDAVTENLATDNLTQSSSVRTYTVGSSKRIVFSNGAVQFSDGSAVSHQVTGGVFDAMSANGIRLSDGDNDYHIDLKPKSELTGSYTITLPNAAPGSANRILEANATGDLSWIDTPSGSGSGTTINNNADNRVITGSGTANTLEAESDLTFNNSTGQLDVSGRGVFGGHITISPNNNAFQGKRTDSQVRQLIKCNASGNTEVGNSNEKTLLQGSVIDAQSLELICGTLNAEKIDAAPVSSPSAGDIGKGAEVLVVAASQTVQAGKAYYLNSSSNWSGADKDVEAAASGFLVMATGSDANNGMLIRGIISPNSLQGSPSVGDKIYLGDNSTFTSDISGFTDGDFIRVVGHYIATDLIYFNPSQEYIELA